MMENLVCLPARGAFPRSSGNGGPGLNEYSVTTGRLGLGLVGLEGDALGSGALFARDRDNQLFLGLGRRRVPAKTARGMFDRLNWGDGCDFFVDGSCSQRRRRQEKPCRTSMNFLVGARTCSCTASGQISSQGLLAEPGLCQRRQELAPRGLLLRCYRSST